MENNEELIKGIEQEVIQEEELEYNTDKFQDIDLEKEKEIKEKAAALYYSVQAGETKYLHQKVAYILNKYEETRNSDVTLMIKYWEVFENHTGDTVSLKDLYQYERLPSITRARAKIQNEFKLFLPTKEKIRRHRIDQQEIEKEYQLSTKPETLGIDIFADETGKTADYTMVGSLWILDQSRSGELHRALVDWNYENKDKPNYPKEFHFKEIDNGGNNLVHYKNFTEKFLSMADMYSFKAISVNKTKLKKIRIQDLVNELFYQLVRQGLEHELDRKRIESPRQIHYIKDEDSDDNRFTIKQLSQKISDAFRTHYEDRIILNSVVSLDSKTNNLIQIADLFSGSLNRIYNHQPKNTKKNAKDEFAEYFLDRIDLKVIATNTNDLLEDKIIETSDMSVIYQYHD